MNKASRMIRVTIAVALVMALGLLAACAAGTGSVEPASGTSAGGSASSEPPTVKVVAPAAGATVPAGTVTVVVETTGLEFVMPSGTNVAGQGHVHFTLDDRPFEMSIEPQLEFEDVEPGVHTLVAELVQNDTDSFDPPVVQEIEFIVE